MEARSRKLAYVIGTDKINGETQYRVLECEIAEDKERTTSPTGMVWNYKPYRFVEQTLIRYMQQVKVVNVAIKNGKVAGSTGSLTRFSDGADIVVLSKIVEYRTERVLGYRVARTSGIVNKVKAAELLGICRKAYDNGQVAVQNAMYVSRSNEQREHLREYVDGSIIKEYMMPSVKVNATRTQPVASQKASDKSNGDEMGFTKEQMKVLKQAMEEGIDITPIKNPAFKADCMKFYVSELKAGCDITVYLNPEYSLGQLAVLSEAWESGVDMSKLQDPKMKVQDMQEIYERLSNNIWSIDYNGNVLNAELVK